MLLKYYHIAKTLIDNFECFEMYYIPRESNTKKTRHLKTIIQETLQTPTIDTKEVMTGEEQEPYWITPYKNFIIRGMLPSDENEAQRLKRKASY